MEDMTLRNIVRNAVAGGCAALLVSIVMGLLAMGAPAQAGEGRTDAKLRAAIADTQRRASHSARDSFRHPYGVLRFFELKDNLTVVEIAPGRGGYWTEILAPYLRGNGVYYAAQTDRYRNSAPGKPSLGDKIASDPKRFGKVRLSRFVGDRHEIAPAGAADLVLTFRNIHNWMKRGRAESSFRAFFQALKPGGILGVVEHRGRVSEPQDPKAVSGYVREDYAIALVEGAGFKLVARSQINANPKDAKDHPKGVWTLPPSYRLGAQDRAKYRAIGESDRFTLKFVKPRR